MGESPRGGRWGADRFATHRLLTLDRHHFSVVRALDGPPFELLP